MKLTEIVTELASILHEEAFDENKVNHWLHELKLHRSDLSDRPHSSGLLLEEIDARILQIAETEPRDLVRTIAEVFNIPVSTVHLHLTSSPNMKSRHFKWVPHFLSNDLRAKRSEGTPSLLGVVKSQEKVIFEI
jgi:hypothetical protein